MHKYYDYLLEGAKMVDWVIHGGRRRPMCDPEGCSTVWGVVGGGGGTPHLR